jgi:hypothetical protein
MTNTPSPAERDRFEQALKDFRNASNALANAWQYMPGDAVENYPPFLPSFDEADAAISRMYAAERFTARNALDVLQSWSENANGFELPAETELISHCPGMYVVHVPLGGEAFLWIGDDMSGEDAGWQCCLYLGSDHEGYYLPDAAYPSTAEALVETVEALVAARDLAASIHEEMFSIDARTGVLLVMKGGGVVSGTLHASHPRPLTHGAFIAVDVTRSAATPSGGHVRNYTETRSIALLDIAKALAI